MPWTPESFRSKHNKKLSLSQARYASSIANAMLRRGLPESEAIATANARAEGKKPRKRRAKRRKK